MKWPGFTLALGLSAAFWGAVDAALLSRWPLHPIVPVARPAVVESERWGTPASCGECHQEQYRAWRASGHGHAGSSPLFRVAFQAEPYQLCLDCHAPSELAASVALQKGAVTCGVCHARSGGIATTRPHAVAPHPLVVDRSLAAATSCAKCHQFTFPLSAVVSQGTAAEAVPESSCASCHLANHRFPGSRDVALLRQALPMEGHLAGAPGAWQLDISLGPVAAGHRVPTGDPGRSISLNWIALGPKGERLDWGRRTFGREFRSSMSEKNHVVIKEDDSRFHPGETRRISIPLADRGRHIARVNVELSMNLVPDRLATLALRAGESARVVIHQRHWTVPLH